MAFAEKLDVGELAFGEAAEKPQQKSGKRYILLFVVQNSYEVYKLVAFGRRIVVLELRRANGITELLDPCQNFTAGRSASDENRNVAVVADFSVRISLYSFADERLYVVADFFCFGLCSADVDGVGLNVVFKAENAFSVPFFLLRFRFFKQRNFHRSARTKLFAGRRFGYEPCRVFVIDAAGFFGHGLVENAVYKVQNFVVTAEVVVEKHRFSAVALAVSCQPFRKNFGVCRAETVDALFDVAHGEHSRL